MLPVILTILVFYLIKKKMEHVSIVIFLFVIGILASDLGILA